MAKKTIVILGGGIGGIVAARELKRLLGHRHRVVVIDKNPVHAFPPSFLWVMVGWRKPAAIQKPLSLLEKYGIEFHNAAVRAIHLHKQTVETDITTFSYDYLVIALGAELTPQQIPGLTEAAHSFYSLEGAERLYRALKTLSGGTVGIAISSLPYKCPPAPYEAALLIESYLLRKGASGVAIKVFTPEATPLQVAGPSAGRALQDLLQQRRIDLYTGHKLSIIQPTKKQVTFENGSTAEVNLLISIPPHQAPEVVRAAGLTNTTGWIPVDQRTMRTEHPNVFAIGDVTVIPLPSGLPLPKAGVFVVNQAEVVAHNIARQVQNHGATRQFDGIGYCFLETGNGKAAYMNGDFFVSQTPSVTFHEPSVKYHWAKVVFEKYWLWRWF